MSGFPDKIRETGNDDDHNRTVSKIYIQVQDKAGNDQKNDAHVFNM